MKLELNKGNVPSSEMYPNVPATFHHQNRDPDREVALEVGQRKDVLQERGQEVWMRDLPMKIRRIMKYDATKISKTKSIQSSDELNVYFFHDSLMRNKTQLWSR